MLDEQLGDTLGVAVRQRLVDGSMLGVIGGDLAGRQHLLLDEIPLCAGPDRVDRLVDVQQQRIAGAPRDAEVKLGIVLGEEVVVVVLLELGEHGAHAIELTLPYSGERFSVPWNVDIIGTMNTADKSLASLDTALRRRFEFMPLLPDTRDEDGAPLQGLRVTCAGRVIDIPRMLGAMNRRIEALYDRDHAIGHAYFTALRRVDDGEARFVALSRVFRHKILPLLEEYFFEDWQKIHLVLADNQKKPEAARYILRSESHEDDLDHLFGDDHDLESYSTRPRYVLQESAFANVDAYVGIYESLID